jgi:hypothetical protein
VDKPARHHPVGELGQGGVVHQHLFGQRPHRPAGAVGEDFEHAPLLHRDVFGLKPRIEIGMQAPVRPGELIGQIGVDGGRRHVAGSGLGPQDECARSVR